ncbi:MAG: DNA-protecting protein DprA, partial [Patescibacteria group bacterium]
GQIYSPASVGTNHLIQQGAKLIRNAQDILEELNIEFSEARPKQIGEYNMEEGLIITALESESLNTDAIIKITGLNPAVALTAITMLELKKIIKNIGNNVYTINN